MKHTGNNLKDVKQRGGDAGRAAFPAVQHSAGTLFIKTRKDCAAMEREINDYADVLNLLDSMVEGISWDAFYSTRNKPAPFILQNESPDESLTEILSGHSFRTALELGCGEGRNAVYMAGQGIAVTAIDTSPVAIENARRIAREKGAAVNFECADALDFQSDNPFDFIYDSGMFHHLAPHRRLTYLELLDRLLAPGAYFGLTCFAWGDFDKHGADEVTDWAFYEKRRFGVAFKPERLKTFFAPQLDLVSIRKMKDGVPDTIQGLTFMWAALFKKRAAQH